MSEAVCYDTSIVDLQWLKPGRGPVGSASDSSARGPGTYTQSSHILSFLLPLIQEGQLSVIGKSICTKYWLIA